MKNFLARSRRLNAYRWCGGVVLLCAAASALTQDAPAGSISEGTSRGLSISLSTWGPTGLINIPTAYVTRPGEVSLSSSFARDRRGPSGNYGVIRDVEVGAAYVEREGFRGKVIGNAKVLIRPANFDNVEIGLGVIDAFDAVEQTVYLVGSVDLVPLPATDDLLGEAIALKIHAGYGSGVFREKLIGGAELAFNRRFAILGEYDGTSGNFGFRFAPNRNTAVQVGYRDDDAFFKMTMSFPL